MNELSLGTRLWAIRKRSVLCCPCLSPFATVECHTELFNSSSLFPTTVKSRFFESSISRTFRFFEPWYVSLGFASVKQCNFVPDFSNPRFFETPDFWNQFLPPLEEIYKKFTFDFSNLHKILKLLLSSFHLNGHTSQTQKVQPPSVTQ